MIYCKSAHITRTMISSNISSFSVITAITTTLSWGLTGSIIFVCQERTEFLTNILFWMPFLYLTFAGAFNNFLFCNSKANGIRDNLNVQTNVLDVPTDLVRAKNGGNCPLPPLLGYANALMHLNLDSTNILFPIDSIDQLVKPWSGNPKMRFRISHEWTQGNMRSKSIYD